MRGRTQACVVASRAAVATVVNEAAGFNEIFRFSLLSRHCAATALEAAWRKAEPKSEYDVVIVVRRHGLATVLSRDRIRHHNVAVLEKAISARQCGRNTTLSARTTCCPERRFL